MINTIYLDSIRSFEGYTARAKWDYAQHTNGYGTKAAFPGEVIDRSEAEQRFRREIADAAAKVDAFASNLDDGTRAALTSLTFNAGTKWMQSGLGAAIEKRDFESAQRIFLQYTKAGGADLAGLVSRRLEEATWFGEAGARAPGKDFHAVALAEVVSGNESEPAARVSVNPGNESDPHRTTVEFFEQIKRDQLRLLVLTSEDEAARDRERSENSSVPI